MKFSTLIQYFFASIKICPKVKNEAILLARLLCGTFSNRFVSDFSLYFVCYCAFFSRHLTMYILYRFCLITGTKYVCLVDVWVVSLTLHAISRNGISRELKICMQLWKNVLIIYHLWTFYKHHSKQIDMNAKNKSHFLSICFWLNNYAVFSCFMLLVDQGHTDCLPFLLFSALTAWLTREHINRSTSVVVNIISIHREKNCKKMKETVTLAKGIWW